MPRLSKSKVMSSLQCAKKVHLEVHHRDLARYSASTEAAFALGNAVGDMAIELYGGSEGVFIAWARGSFGPALRQTGDLMSGLIRTPVFEATLEHENVLVREDVLLPVANSWRVVEIKASTKLKPEHVQDCAIQAWVHRGAGYELEAIALGHVNNQFVYQGDGNYEGLIIEQDLTAQVMDLQTSVPLWVEAAREAVDGEMPRVEVGAHCFSPYDCPFIEHCWPKGAEYPLQGLGGQKKHWGEWLKRDFLDIRDVPASELNEIQLRIHTATVSGEAELKPGAGEAIRNLAYPRYYLDFEAVAPPVPVFAGTRPYQAQPFQYSCHIEYEDGEVEQVEFLDMSGEAPMRPLAEKLISDLGTEGPVLMYTSYERRIITFLAERFADLAGPLNAIIDRLFDLQPVVKQNYYHPEQLGSWSIKKVLPTIAPELDYEELEGIAEGTAAAREWLAAIQPATAPQERARVEAELLAYCRHDTLAMLRIAQFFAEQK